MVRAVCLLTSLLLLPAAGFGQGSSADALRAIEEPCQDLPRPAPGASAYDKEANAALEALYKCHKSAIARELESVQGHDWAGKYSFGTGYTWEEFWIAPSGRYARNKGSDVLSALFTGETGRAILVGNQFLLRRSPEVEPRTAVAFTSGPHLIRWRNYRFLVEPERMFWFVGVLNGSESPEAICGRMCLAVSGGAVAAPPVPEVPAPWNLYLLPTPVQATLKAIHSKSAAGEGASGRETYYASVDKGANAGLRPGMWLHGRYNVLVESVSAEESLVRYVGNSNPPFRTNDPPAVGDRLSTRHAR